MPTLGCPSCSRPFMPDEILVNCRVSWPNQRWLLFVCPHCAKSAHVEVADGRMAIGELDGAPGPCFMPAQAIGVRGLEVTAPAHGVTVSLHGKTTVIPAKR